MRVINSLAGVGGRRGEKNGTVLDDDAVGALAEGCLHGAELVPPRCDKDRD